MTWIASGMRPLLGMGRRVIDYGHLQRQAPPDTGVAGRRDKSEVAKSLLRAQKELQSDFRGNVPMAEDEVAERISFFGGFEVSG